VVDTDDIVGVASEQIRTISRPGEAGAEWNLGVLSNRWEWDLEFVNHGLGLQIPDLDTGGGGSDKPVAVGGEHKGVDDITSLELVKLLAFGQIPKHGSAILSS